MKPHPEYLRGIQAAIGCLEVERALMEHSRMHSGIFHSLLALTALLRNEQQSTPPAVADQKGGSNADA